MVNRENKGKIPGCTDGGSNVLGMGISGMCSIRISNKTYTWICRNTRIIISSSTSIRISSNTYTWISSITYTIISRDISTRYISNTNTRLSSNSSTRYNSNSITSTEISINMCIIFSCYISARIDSGLSKY